jgi:predicted PurR-regulated permease PerM
MVFVAILFWGWTWGIIGVFLAVPVLAALKIICDDIEWLKPVGLVLGSTKGTLSRMKGKNGAG